MTFVLHDYQRVAVDHLHRNPRGAIMLDMGLGKTAVVLSALTPDHLPALVTAPKRVAENVWEEEARRWRPDLRVGVAAGSPAARGRVLAGVGTEYDVVVIGRDNLHDAIPHAHQFNTFVLDELSGFKSGGPRGSNRWKSANKIANNKARPMPYVWGMTGTPVPNGLLDLFAQVYLLDRGERLGSNITQYRNRYFTAGRQLPNGVVIEWNLRPGAEQRIHNLIDDICLSMSTEGRVDLPPTTFNPVTVPLPANVKQMYKRFKSDLVLDLSLLGGTVHTAQTAGILTSRLAQISAGFLYHDADLGVEGYDVLHREKIAALQEILDGTGSPVLVFYRFRAEAEMIRQSVKGIRTIDEPGVIQEWNAGRVPVLLAHPASAGHGLNLQHGGHTIVWTSLPYSLEEWEQANKRLARQGQKHPVVIHILQSPRTVDIPILEALRNKASVQDALLKHLESPL